MDAAGLYRSVDTTGLDDAARSAMTERAAADAAGELDPAAGVVLRAVRFGGDGAPGRLLLCVHHLAVDGVSWRVLMDDLAEAWAAVSEDRPVRLTPGGASFRDWAAHLQRQAHSPEVMAELPYWQAVLAPCATPSAAPALWERVPVPTRDTAGTTRTLTLDLPAEVAAPLLSAVPAALRTGPAEILLAALALAARAIPSSRAAPRRCCSTWRATAGPTARAGTTCPVPSAGSPPSTRSGSTWAASTRPRRTPVATRSPSWWDGSTTRWRPYPTTAPASACWPG
ncbi:condensation domain-containing protein [Streptomyces cirratus]